METSKESLERVFISIKSMAHRNKQFPHLKKQQT